MRSQTRRNRKLRGGTVKVFTDAQYNSGDGMLTSVWGPSIWHFLHTMSFNYPVNPSAKEKQIFKSFVLSLRDVLPCKYCRQNLRKNLAKLPLTADRLANREAFSRYIYELHELVNKMLNKDSGLTYDVVRERYEHFRSRCTQNELPKVVKVEKGCTEPLWGKKSRCVIKIVPQDVKTETLTVDSKCLKKRI